MTPCGPDSDSPNPRTHNGQKARKSKAAHAAVALQIAWHLTANWVRCQGGRHLMTEFEVRTCVQAAAARPGRRHGADPALICALASC